MCTTKLCHCIIIIGDKSSQSNSTQYLHISDEYNGISVRIFHFSEIYEVLNVAIYPWQDYGISIANTSIALSSHSVLINKRSVCNISFQFSVLIRYKSCLLYSSQWIMWSYSYIIGDLVPAGEHINTAWPHPWSAYWRCGNATRTYGTNYLGPILLTWINSNPNIDK